VISILLVEDHLTLRQALHAVFAIEDDLELVAETAEVIEAIRLAALRPSVAIIDLGLPEGSGVDAIEQIRVASPSTRCIVLTALADDAELGRAIQAGAAAILHKSVDISVLLDAIRSVASGATLLAPEDTARRLQALDRARQQRWETAAVQATLTTREQQVLELLATGADGRQIARALAISPQTSETHIRNLMGKLDARSRLEAVAKALRLGLVRAP
jgi:DNA-binding NarL/FixJ family response regulator